MANAAVRKKTNIKIHTADGWRIQGETTIRAGGYRGRLSDFLNDPQAFIAVENAAIHSADGEIFAQGVFLCINKQNISLVIEE